jgi:hypothetical protein
MAAVSNRRHFSQRNSYSPMEVWGNHDQQGARHLPNDKIRCIDWLGIVRTLKTTCLAEAQYAECPGRLPRLEHTQILAADRKGNDKSTA